MIKGKGAGHGAQGTELRPRSTGFRENSNFILILF